MRRALALLLCALMTLPVFAANIPSANKFVKPIQNDVGTLCTNATATSTQWTLEPCTTGTDVVADCTTGELLNITEATGDRSKFRCFSPGTSTFSYSAIKHYLNDSVSYSDGTITTEAYRGVDIRGTALAINAATSGGSGSCSGASNLVSNPGFEGTTYNARTGEQNPMPDHWALKSQASLFTAIPALCHGGSACLRFNGGTGGNGDATTRAQQAAFIGNAPGGVFTCICDSGGAGPGVPSGTQSYIQLSKNQTYTLTFWLDHTFTAGGGAVSGALDFQLQIFASDTVNSYANCTTTGCTPSYGPATYGITGNSASHGTTLTPTWTTTIGSATSLFKDVNDDGTYHQYTVTLDTSGLTSLAADPFYVHIDLKGFDTTRLGHDYFLDDLAFCHPGVSVNATAVTARALTEDQLNWTPTTTGNGDSLSLGPFIGADITPKIAPNMGTGGTITQTSAIAVQAGLPYTADSDGTYTLTTATSLKAKKPEIGTTKYAAEFQGDVLMSDPDSTASKLIFQEGGNGGETVSLEAPPSLAANVRYQLPPIPTLASSLMTCTAATPSVCTWTTLGTLGAAAVTDLTLSANQNDYEIGASFNVARITPTGGDRNITGFPARADKSTIDIINISTTNSIQFVIEDSGSSAANRIAGQSGLSKYILKPGQGASFIYTGGGLSRWNLRWFGNGLSGAGQVGQMAIWTSGNNLSYSGTLISPLFFADSDSDGTLDAVKIDSDGDGTSTSLAQVDTPASLTIDANGDGTVDWQVGQLRIIPASDRSSIIGTVYHGGGGNLRIKTAAIEGIDSGDVAFAIFTSDSVNSQVTRLTIDGGVDQADALFSAETNVVLQGGPLSINSGATVLNGTSGKITTYDSITTAGKGVVPIHDVVQLTGQTGDVGPIDFPSTDDGVGGGTASGLYRVSLYLTTGSSLATGTIVGQITWADENGTSHMLSTPSANLAGNSQAQATFFIEAGNSGSGLQHITYASKTTALVGTPSYSFYATLEKLSD